MDSAFAVRDIADDPHYERVLRMVLWGEKRSEVYHAMAVNGIFGERADDLYAEARSERIGVIQAEYWPHLRTGLLLMTAAAATFSICWWGFGFIPRYLLFLDCAGLAWGVVKIIGGLGGMAMAAAKEGPVGE